MKIAISIMLTLLMCGCFLHSGGLKISSDDQNYLTSAYNFPLTFSVTQGESDSCWSRAKEWVGNHASKKIQNANDFMIQTFNPSSDEYAFGYYVTKNAVRDSVQIAVQCVVGNLFAKKDQENNAHILAYYIKTGLVIPKLIVKK
jgi:hypothetical protein